MGSLVMGMAVIVIFVYGTCRIRGLAGQGEPPVLCLALNEGAYAESLLRMSVREIRRRGLPCRLVVLVDGSWEAFRITSRLSEKLVFTAVNLETEGLDLEHRRFSVLDMRHTAGSGAKRLKRWLAGEIEISQG